MKRYRLLSISPNYEMQESIAMHTTDPDVIDFLFSKLKEEIPSVRCYGGANSCTFEQLDNKDTLVGWLLMMWLGDEGWEPFAVHQKQRSELSSTTWYDFRKVIEE